MTRHYVKLYDTLHYKFNETLNVPLLSDLMFHFTPFVTFDTFCHHFSLSTTVTLLLQLSGAWLVVTVAMGNTDNAITDSAVMLTAPAEKLI